MMKFVADRPYADPDAVARKIVELAHAVEAVQDGHIHIEKIKGRPSTRQSSISRLPRGGW